MRKGRFLVQIVLLEWVSEKFSPFCTTGRIVLILVGIWIGSNQSKKNETKLKINPTSMLYEMNLINKSMNQISACRQKMMQSTNFLEIKARKARAWRRKLNLFIGILFPANGFMETSETNRLLNEYFAQPSTFELSEFS